LDSRRRFAFARRRPAKVEGGKVKSKKLAIAVRLSKARNKGKVVPKKKK